MAKSKVYNRSFFIEMNMQNPPKPQGLYWYVRKADETSLDPTHVVEGFEFTEEIKKDSIGKLEGFSPKLNFRMAFLPEEDSYVVSRDFSGQELRILANLSGEPSWIQTFLNGGDIHKATAISLWGEENYSHKRRKQAKAINFGLVYGISATGLSKSIGVSQDEAQNYIDLFFEKHQYIRRFLDRQVIYVKNHGELKNLYGRKRRFHNYIDDWGNVTGAGIRRAYNTPIQSLGAEVTKIGILRVYYNVYKNPIYKNKVFWMSTIHDEINSSVHKSVIKEAVRDLGIAMDQKLQFGDFPVPIMSGLEIGHSMGLTWKFKQDKETLELTPEYEPLEEDDLKKLEEEK